MKCLLLAIGVLAAFCSSAPAAENNHAAPQLRAPKSSKEYLVGIQKAYVWIDASDSFFQDGTLSSDDVKAAAESKLKAAGLQIDPERKAGPKTMMVSITVTGLHVNDTSLDAYVVRIECFQVAPLPANPTVAAPLLLWWGGAITSGERDETKANLLGDLKDKLGALTASWAKANGR